MRFFYFVLMLAIGTLALAQDNVYEIRSPQFPADRSIKLVWKSSTDSTAVARDLGTWQRDSLYRQVEEQRNALYGYLSEWYRKTMQFIDPELYRLLNTPPPAPVPEKKNKTKR